MSFLLETRDLRRPFARPLPTAHGTWTVRESLLVRVERGNGRFGFGEAAVLPSHRTESHEEARRALRALGREPDAGALAEVPAHLPCLRFALACARDMAEGAGLFGPARATPGWRTAALLALDDNAPSEAARRAGEGYSTLKVKIGAGNPTEEARLLEALARELPAGVRLRLDANGAFDEGAARRWLEALAPLAERIDFLEQPLPARLDGAEIATTRTLAEESPVHLALDESVTTLTGLSRALAAEWPGVYVVKPALAGDPAEVLAALQSVRERVVVSSAFEAAPAYAGVLAFAAQLYDGLKVWPEAGLGTAAFFPAADGWRLPGDGPLLPAAEANLSRWQHLWEQLS